MQPPCRERRIIREYNPIPKWLVLPHVARGLRQSSRVAILMANQPSIKAQEKLSSSSHRHHLSQIHLKVTRLDLLLPPHSKQ